MQSFIPKTWEEIPDCLRQMTEKSKFLGGGTDLIIKLHSGQLKPDALCYLGYVRELREIREQEEGLSIGAYLSMTELERDPRIKARYPALMRAAADVGSVQIRNNGTLGGNIGNASPAGDLLPVLCLYEAKVETMGPGGLRRLPIEDVLLSPGRMSLSYNEAIVRILLPPCTMETAFLKLGSRKKLTISRIGIALGAEKEDGRIRKLRLYIGAVSIKPLRLKAAEELAIGKRIGESEVLAMAEILSDYIREHVPEEFDRDYKVWAARGAMLDIFSRLKLISAEESEG